MKGTKRDLVSWAAKRSACRVQLTSILTMWWGAYFKSC